MAVLSGEEGGHPHIHDKGLSTTGGKDSTLVGTVKGKFIDDLVSALTVALLEDNLLEGGVS